MNNSESKYLFLDGVSKQYGQTVAIDNISLVVNQHELLAVVGPSGCGKTTLLRLISGLAVPDKGLITLRNNILFRKKPDLIVPPNQRKIGMVFQNYALWPHMNVFKNIAYPLRVKRVAKAEQIKAVETALSLVHLAGCESRYPHQLSGGEQQRVALARALTMQPEILLLDEPLSNLDAHLREEMGMEIKRIQRETGITIIYVTHDQNEALALANRIAVMDHGQIMQVGHPINVYQQPKNSFVAEFIGISNLLNCQIVSVNGRTNALLPDQSLIEIKELVGKAAGSVRLSIRPEDIVLCSEGNGAEGTIRAVRYHGNFVRYKLDSATINLIIETASTCKFQVGDRAHFYFRHAVVISDN